MKRFTLTVVALAGSLCFTHSSLAQEAKTAAVSTEAVPRVEVKDFMFQPAALTVKAGTKVTFVNHDEEPHTVASADGKFTRSHALDTDQEFSVTLTVPGEYAYFCTVHPHMTGKILVTGP